MATDGRVERFYRWAGCALLKQIWIKKVRIFVLTSMLLFETKFQRMVLVLGSMFDSVLYVARSTTIRPLITSMLVWGIWIWAHTPVGRKMEERSKEKCPWEWTLVAASLMKASLQF